MLTDYMKTKSTSGAGAAGDKADDSEKLDTYSLHAQIRKDQLWDKSLTPEDFADIKSAESLSHRAVHIDNLKREKAERKLRSARPWGQGGSGDQSGPFLEIETIKTRFEANRKADELEDKIYSCCGQGQYGAALKANIAAEAEGDILEDDERLNKELSLERKETFDFYGVVVLQCLLKSVRSQEIDGDLSFEGPWGSRALKKGGQKKLRGAGDNLHRENSDSGSEASFTGILALDVSESSTDESTTVSSSVEERLDKHDLPTEKDPLYSDPDDPPGHDGDWRFVSKKSIVFFASAVHINWMKESFRRLESFTERWWSERVDVSTLYWDSVSTLLSFVEDNLIRISAKFEAKKTLLIKKELERAGKRADVFQRQQSGVIGIGGGDTGKSMNAVGAETRSMLAFVQNILYRRFCLAEELFDLNFFVTNLKDGLIAVLRAFDLFSQAASWYSSTVCAVFEEAAKRKKNLFLRLLQTRISRNKRSKTHKTHSIQAAAEGKEIGEVLAEKATRRQRYWRGTFASIEKTMIPKSVKKLCPKPVKMVVRGVRRVMEGRRRPEEPALFKRQPTEKWKSTTSLPSVQDRFSSHRIMPPDIVS